MQSTIAFCCKDRHNVTTSTNDTINSPIEVAYNEGYITSDCLSHSTGDSGISGHSRKSSNLLLSVTPILQLLQSASQPLHLCFEVIDDASLLFDMSCLGCYRLALRSTLFQSGCCHAFAYATFGDKLAVATFKIFRDGLIYLMTKADSHIGQLFIVISSANLVKLLVS